MDDPNAHGKIAARENEAALIGSILKNPAQFDQIKDDLKVDDFWEIGLKACWKAFHTIRDNGMTIDQVTVGDELERAGILQEITSGQWTGRQAISAIRDAGTPRGAQSYAENVLDYSAKRQLLERLSRGAEWSLNGRRSVEIQADMMEAIASVQTPNQKADKHTMTLKDALSQAYDRTDDASRGKIKLLYTDFIDLDKLIHGFEGGDLVILAARPGQGKTAFVTNIALNMAKKKKRVILFSLEMQGRQIAMRLIQMESGVSYGAQKDGKLTEGEWPLYTHAIEQLNYLPIHICDLPGIRLREMRKAIRKIVAQYGEIDAIIVDYLQLASPDDDNSRVREQEVSKVARGLKNLAKDEDVPLFACAQLSRALEVRAEKRPMLSDLRESGEIEQAADIVMFIYRPDQYEKDTTKQNVTELIVAKQRNGPPGTVELIFRSALTKFENATSKVVNFDDRRNNEY